MTFHSRHPIRQLLLTILLACTLMLPRTDIANAAGDAFPLILLSCYHQSIPIDGQFLLVAVTPTGSIPKFKSSSSAIASVNT